MKKLPPPGTDEWHRLVDDIVTRHGIDLPVSRPPTVAQQLLVARFARAMTQDVVARTAGVRRATVADIEAGRAKGQNPKVATLAAIGWALGLAAIDGDGWTLTIKDRH